MRYRCEGCGTIIEFTNTRMMTWKNCKKCLYCKDTNFYTIPDTPPDRLDAIRKRAEALGMWNDQIEVGINDMFDFYESKMNVREKYQRLDRKEV
jgi:CRISPR/Cas system-associated protein Cas10 (large subunit of type III CRISPR-Cas system)